MWNTLLDASDWDALTGVLENADPKEAAEFLACLQPEAFEILCGQLDNDCIAEILVVSTTEVQERIISALHDRDLEDVMDEVSVEATIDIIEDMPDKTAVVLRIAKEDEIVRLVEEKKYVILKPLLAELNPTDLAQILDELTERDAVVVFRILPKELAAETFVEMGSDLKKHLLSALNDVELKAITDELFLDDTVDLIEEMPANVVRRIIAQADHDTRAHINALLDYPKNSAGSIMTIEFVSLKSYMTVEQAFQRIRETGIDKETIYTCYVTDEKNKLLGVVTVKNLLLANFGTLIGECMENNVIYAETHDDQEVVARQIEKYGFLALPVVDREQRLVGIVTVDDAMTILQKEASEDIAIMSAVTPSTTPYLKTSVFRLWLNRVPWLLLLMVSATFTGLIITANESILSASAFGIVLTACIPMLMDTGGNAGSQASATIIRGVALGEIQLHDVLKATWKELRLSLLLGVTLSVACFGKLMAIDQLWRIDHGIMVSLVVCIAMFITIVIAKIIGCILPLAAKICRLDPAVVASPFITTIVDTLSLIIYCAMAISMLGGLS